MSIQRPKPKPVLTGCIWQFKLQAETLNKYLREVFFEKINNIYPEFIHLSDPQKLPYLCGEKSQCAVTAAKYVKCCHALKETSSVVNVSE